MQTYFMLANDLGQYGEGLHIAGVPLIEWHDTPDQAQRFESQGDAESWLNCYPEARVVKAEVITVWTDIPRPTRASRGAS